jgi:hypothetical protein
VVASPLSRVQQNTAIIHPLRTSPANLAGTLASTGEPLPLRSYLLDLDLMTLLESLTEPVWDDLIRPDLLKSNGLSSRSNRNGTVQSEVATFRLTI